MDTDASPFEERGVPSLTAAPERDFKSAFPVASLSGRWFRTSATLERLWNFPVGELAPLENLP